MFDTTFGTRLLFRRRSFSDSKQHIVRVMIALVIGLAVGQKTFAQGYTPQEAAGKMNTADGFSVSLTASEPNVRQPVAIDFDNRGRLWVVQYLQYPNPAGLKRVTVDRYSRTVYDRVPKPPPHGPRGADRITILEDSDGDGFFENAKDFVDGLNLTTGLALGHGGAFVLNVPYLLFYPDRNGDDVPDSNPEVLLKGFGMEDTSSLANSLTWGPDGWLYGTQGTNITASIRGIEFEQGVWRYHPLTRKFELFCEGGGNTWGLDFDRDGNLLYSTNYGGYLMHHGVQGAYYAKSFGKHGELHNPYAFGYFEHVPHKGFKGGHVTVGGLVYQGGSFPERFRNKYIGGDLLGHGVNWHRIIPVGATFRTEHGGELLEANDTWFAPSDVTLGPDGAIYVADWHDKRTAHPDPDAEWDRRNGRVFRIQADTAENQQHIDPASLSSDQLVDRLSHKNIWHVRRAHLVLAERRDPEIVPQLRRMALENNDDMLALRALWALYVSGGLDDETAGALLRHRYPAVRGWTVRFLGDAGHVSPEQRQTILKLAANESDPYVCSQLACTAARLPAADALPVVRALASRDELVDDPYIPLLCWWAIERNVVDHSAQVLELFSTPEAWGSPIVRDVLIDRLVRRFAAEGNSAGFEAAARLIDSAPDEGSRQMLLGSLYKGLALIGKRKQTGLPLGTAFAGIANVKSDTARRAKRFENVPEPFVDLLKTSWNRETTDPLIVRLAVRLGSEPAYRRTIERAADKNAALVERLTALDILSQLADEQCLPALLPLLGSEEPDEIQMAALKVVAKFRDDKIAKQVLAAYPDLADVVRARARNVLLGRADWAHAFLMEIDDGTYKPKEVSIEELRRVALHEDTRIEELVRKHWGGIRAGTPEEKLAEIRRLSNDLRAADGNQQQGQKLFTKHCANCHQLFGEGKKLGPELTNANRKDREYLLVSLVDPGAQIRKEFMSYVVVTADGRVIDGLMIGETPTDVTLVNAKDEKTTIARSDIEELKPSDVSLMPEKLLKPLSPQEVRDLFAYLQK